MREELTKTHTLFLNYSVESNWNQRSEIMETSLTVNWNLLLWVLTVCITFRSMWETPRKKMRMTWTRTPNLSILVCHATALPKVTSINFPFYILFFYAQGLQNPSCWFYIYCWEQRKLAERVICLRMATDLPSEDSLSIGHQLCPDFLTEHHLVETPLLKPQGF